VPGGKGSWLFIVAPELKVRSDWERHQLNADIKGNYFAYSETFGFNAAGVPTGTPNSLDRPSLDARVNGRVDVNSRSRFDVEGRLIVGTDNPGQPQHPGRARPPADHHHGRRNVRLHAELQPLRADGEDHGRSQRLAGLDADRRRDLEQRRPQLRPVRRRLSRRLRPQARYQAVRRGRRRHARARSPVRPQRRARLERVYAKVGTVRVHPQAHRLVCGGF
jgi:hypothetical protein